jgi:hypothetical protein
MALVSTDHSFRDTQPLCKPTVHAKDVANEWRLTIYAAVFATSKHVLNMVD